MPPNIKIQQPMLSVLDEFYSHLPAADLERWGAE
jgi:hypothetical protein